MAALDEHGLLMDRVYRRQRHFYDVTRRFFLLGRDSMLAGLKPPEKGSVLEIGCGTGRNLLEAASLYPSARLFGVDISREMLGTARRSIAARGASGRIAVAFGDAEELDPERLFGLRTFDRVFISYALSMIPQWERAIAGALSCLAPGGELHVVDFGDCQGLPRWFERGLGLWLARFHVVRRTPLFDATRCLADACGAEVSERRLLRGFAWIAVARRPAVALPADPQTDLTTRTGMDFPAGTWASRERCESGTRRLHSGK